MSIYNKTIKIPTWIHVDGLNKNKSGTVKAFLDAAGAKEQPWPSQGFYDHLQTYKLQGWAHALKPGLQVDTQLIQRAAAEYVKKVLGRNSTIVVPHTAERWNRVISDQAQGTAFFDALLQSQEDIVLSQMFQMSDLTQSLGRNYTAIYTLGHVNKDVLTRLSNRVIVISDSPEADLNLTDVKNKEVETVLTEFFTKVLSK